MELTDYFDFPDPYFGLTNIHIGKIANIFLSLERCENVSSKISPVHLNFSYTTHSLISKLS